MKKKIISFVLFVTLTALFAGCGKGNNNNIDEGKAGTESDVEMEESIKEGDSAGVTDDSSVLEIPYSDLIDHWKLISVENNGMTDVYEYDAEGHLIREQGGYEQAPYFVYEYDASGNLKKKEIYYYSNQISDLEDGYHLMQTILYENGLEKTVDMFTSFYDFKMNNNDHYDYTYEYDENGYVAKAFEYYNLSDEPTCTIEYNRDASGNELSYVYYSEDGEVIPGDMSYEYVEINGKYYVAKETEESNIEGERYIAENTYSYDEYGNEIGCKVYYSFDDFGELYEGSYETTTSYDYPKFPSGKAGDTFARTVTHCETEESEPDISVYTYRYY